MIAPSCSILTPRLLRCVAGLGLLASLTTVVSAAAGQLVPANGLTTVAGTYGGIGLSSGGYSGDGGPATSAMLNAPVGLARDSAGNLYVADSRNVRVRKISPAGIISTVAGNGTASPGGGIGDGGLATNAEFARPSDVVVDANGNLYIADGTDGRIRKVTAASGIITTIAGGGAATAGPGGAPATSVRLLDPEALALDGTGNLYIADGLGEVVDQVNLATGVLTVVAGNGTAGYSGDGGTPTSAELYGPSSVALDASGNLYIADGGNSVVREITGGKIITVVGNGSPGDSGDGGAATAATLGIPSRLAFDSSNNLYVSDLQYGVIREVFPATGTIRTFAGRQGGYVNDGVAAADANFNGGNEIALAFDASGNLLLTADNRVRRIGLLAPPATATIGTSTSANLILQTTAAESIGAITFPAAIGNVQEYSAASAPTSDCVLDGKTVVPAGTYCTITVTFKPAYPGPRPTTMQVTTSAGIVSFSLKAFAFGPLSTFTPGTLSSVAGTFKMQRDLTVSSDGPGGDGGPATSALFRSVNEVAVDGAGNIYVVDQGANDVRKVNVLTGIITNVAGNDSMGVGYSGDGGPASQAQLDGANGVAVDSAGNVYISDTGNNVIRRVSVSTGIISTVAGNGTRGDTGDGGLAINATLYYPGGLAVDSNDNLYISDFPDNVIRKVNLSTGIITTVAGTYVNVPGGGGGYSGDGGPATSALLNVPRDIALDSANNLYIADSYNRVVRRVDGITGIISTVVGNGSNPTANYGDGGPATSAQLSGPYGVAVDIAGDLYLSDEGTGVIRKVTAATGLISTVAGNPHLGDNPTSPDGTTATAAVLNGPIGLVVSPDGALLFADNGALVVRRISVTGAPLVYPNKIEVGAPDSKDNPQTTILNDIGNAPLTLTAPASGQNPTISSGWSLDRSATCPQLGASSSSFSLAAGASCTFAVDFTPTVSGTNTGTLVLNDSSLSATQTVLLNGTGTSGLSISPTTLTFPSTAVGGTSAALTATLTNTGSVYIPITAGSLTDSTDFTQINYCNNPLGPSETCTVYFTFTPKFAGTLTSTYSIADSSSTVSPLTIALSGTTPVSPILASLAPTAINFGSVVVGPATSSQSVTLSNTGTSPLSLASIAIGGANASMFSQSNNCPASLAGDASCIISVSFSPIAPGTDTATIIVTDNSGGVTGSTQSVALTGTATAPPTGTGALSPTSVSFGTVVVGPATSSQAVALTNTGTGPLAIASIAITGANASMFSQSNNCPASLTAGANCTISVSFSPTAPGTDTAMVIVTDNSGGVTGSTQSIALTGTATAPPTGTGALSPTSVSFGTVSVGPATSSQAVALSNTGTGPLVIASIAIGGANASMFSQYNNCPASLTAGASCTISVSFSPTAAGTDSAAITVTDNSGGTAGTVQSVSLTGTAVMPTATLTPATIALGNVGVGQQTTSTFTLTNTGTVSLSLTGFQFSGKNDAAAAPADPCPRALIPGGTCVIKVVFTPYGIGVFSGTLTYIDTAGTQSATVSGTGTGLTLTPSPSFNFANVALGSSATEGFTLANTTAATVALTSIQVTGSGFAQQSTTCGKTLASAGSCSITVAFAPNSLTAAAGLLAVAESTTGSNPSVALTGTGVAAFTLPTNSVDFGNVYATYYAGSPGTVNLTLTNNASTPFALSFPATMFNPGSVLYGVIGSCTGGSTTSVTIPANGSCVLTLTAEPGLVGPFTNNFVLTDSAGKTYTIAEKGVGVLPLSVSSSSVDFGNVYVNYYSGVGGTVNVTLTNNSSSTIEFILPSLPPAFVVGQALFGATSSCVTGSSIQLATIAGNATCVLSLTVEPAMVGPFSSSYVLTDPGGNTLAIAEKGVGVFPVTTVSSVDFGNAYVNSYSGVTGSVNVTLTNHSAFAVPLNFPTGKLNPGAPIFYANGACVSGTQSSVATVPANGTCVLTLTVDPEIVGSYNNTFVLTDLAGNTLAIAEKVVAVIPITASSSSVDFGNVPVNAYSGVAGTVNVTLTNHAAFAVALTLPTIQGGPNAPIFDATGACVSATPSRVATLPANGTCVLVLTVDPEIVGPFSNNYVLADSEGNALAIAEKGVGVFPVTTSSTVDFGNVFVTYLPSGSTVNVTLTNNSSMPVVLTLPAVSALPGSALFDSTGSCVSGTLTRTATIAGNGACVLTLLARPSTVGPFTNTYVLSDPEGNLLPINEKGTGIFPITASSSSVNFGNVTVNTAASSTVTLVNQAPVAVALTLPPTLVYPGMASFSATSSCGSTPVIAPNSSCVLTLVSQPLGVGTFTSNLVLADLSNNSLSIAESITGIPLVVNITPSSHDFGNDPVYTASAPAVFTITSPAALSQLTVQVSGGAFADTTTCTSSLAAGASCTVSVTFTPTAIGAATGMLTATYAGGSTTAMLTGTGVPNNSDFTFTMTPTTESVPDTSGVFLFNLTFAQAAANTVPFNGTITLTYSGFPDGTTYKFSNVNPSVPFVFNGSTLTIPVYVDIPFHKNASRDHKAPWRSRQDEPLLAFAVGGLALFTVRKRLHRNGRWFRLLALAALFPLLTMTGCIYDLPTTAITFTVTATSGSIVHTAQAQCNTYVVH